MTGQSSSSQPSPGAAASQSSVAEPSIDRPCCGCIPLPSLFGWLPRRDDAFVDRELPQTLVGANVEAAVDEGRCTDVVPGRISNPVAASDLTWEGEELAENGSAPIEAPSLQCQDTIAPPLPEKLMSKVVAIDCGMVRITLAQKKGKKRKKGRRQALRRVCILDGGGSPLLSETVRVLEGSVHPTGYQTKLARQISDHVLPRINKCGDDLRIGISPEEARARAATIVRGKIIVGHSLDGDLKVLGLKNHPPAMVRDTSLYPPFLKDNGKKQTLCVLAKKHLSRDIQHPGKFHCSIEDALAALDLYKSAWKDWEESLSVAPTRNDMTSSAIASMKTTSSVLAATDCEVNGTAAPARNTERKTPPALDETQSQNCPSSTKPTTNAALEARQKEIKERKKEARKRKKLRQELENERIAIENPVLSHALAYSLATVLLPMKLLLRIVQDAHRLVMDALILTWRAIRLRRGIKPSPYWSQKQRKHRRDRFLRRVFSYSLQRRVMLLRLVCWIDSFILISHSLVGLAEVTLISLWRDKVAASSEDSFEIIDPQGHWAVVSSMLGISLLVARRARHTLQSRICFCILAHYHCIIPFMSSGNGEGTFLCAAKELGKQAWSESISLRDVSVWSDISHCYDRRDDLQVAILENLYQLYHLTYFSWFILRCVVPQNERIAINVWMVLLGFVLVFMTPRRFFDRLALPTFNLEDAINAIWGGLNYSNLRHFVQIFYTGN